MDSYRSFSLPTQTYPLDINTMLKLLQAQRELRQRIYSRQVARPLQIYIYIYHLNPTSITLTCLSSPGRDLLSATCRLLLRTLLHYRGLLVPIPVLRLGIKQVKKMNEGIKSVVSSAWTDPGQRSWPLDDLLSLRFNITVTTFP